MMKSSPSALRLVDVKVMCGWFSMSKKSALLRCATRWSSPVVTELRSTLASTVDWSGSSAMVAAPLKSVNRPAPC